jgi:hypothetical protein
MIARVAAISIALAGTSAVAEAQFPDLLDTSGQYMPSAALEDPRPVEAQVASYDASFNVPIPLAERTFLIPGAAYHVESVSFSNTPPEFLELRAFHSLELPILFVQLLPDDWSLSFRVAAGLAGDFEEVDGDMVRVSALALATHAFSDRFVLGGGAIASYAFGSFLPLPALYLEYKPIDELQIETFLPAFLQVKVTLFDRLELGARAEFAGNEYAVRDSRVTGRWPCASAPDDPATPQDETVADHAGCLDHIAYSVGLAGVVAGVRLFESVWITAFAGHGFFRRFEQMNEDGDEVLGGPQSLPNTFFVRGGITWRIPRP